MMTTEQAPRDLIGFLVFYLVKRAPFQLPGEILELFVKFGPWIVLVLLVLTVPGLLFMLGVGVTVMPFGGPAYASGFSLLTIVLLAQLVLLAMALPGLFTRKMSAWTLVFYSQLAGIAVSLLAGALFGAIVGGLIGLYLLFQIRALYVN